jgi:hypothetical protein
MPSASVERDVFASLGRNETVLELIVLHLMPKIFERYKTTYSMLVLYRPNEMISFLTK